MIILLRLLPYALVTFIVLWLANIVFQSGVERERNRYEAREFQIQKELNAQREDAERRLEQAEENQRLTILRAQNDYTKNTEELNRTIEQLSRRGLYVSAARCEDTGLPGAKDRKSSGNSTTGDSGTKVRLPETTERDLWSQAADAAEVVELYRICRGIVTSPVCNVEIID